MIGQFLTVYDYYSIGLRIDQS